MRRKRIKYSAYVAVSIDGRIAENSVSGANWTSKEDWNFFQKSLSETDAVIVGYNTYVLAINRLKRRNTIVFTSKKLKQSGSITFLNPHKLHLRDFQKFLQDKNYKSIAILGGPKVYNFFLEHKMLDEIFVTIEPYIFTTGISMFSSPKFKKHSFLLQSVKKLNKQGTLLLKYKYAD